jgi:hypothetical protein
MKFVNKNLINIVSRAASNLFHGVKLMKPESQSQKGGLSFVVKIQLRKNAIQFYLKQIHFKFHVILYEQLIDYQ